VRYQAALHPERWDDTGLRGGSSKLTGTLHEVFDRFMSKKLLRLFPAPTESVALRGLYLGLNLHRRGQPHRPWIYANFLSSLDGRIALEDETGVPYLPKSLTTADDFRLFLELHAQADCLITHGGYLRSLHEGRLGNILQVGDHPLGDDLPAWRASQGLPAQPAIVIASRSLDFPIPQSLLSHGQEVYIATGQDADPAKVQAWERRGFEVIRAGAGAEVNGAVLANRLSSRGYRTLYLIAGPMMLDTMVREGRLSALFQTLSLQLLGGEAFRSMVPGPILGEAGRMRMVSLYHDANAGEGLGQWFARFDLASGEVQGDSV
jgi:riboflavin biosynthesis pyrimidine reductase